jgi:hypothetical protein
MRKRSLCCLTWAALSLLASVGRADDFADFRIPENRYGSGTMSFSGFWDRAHQRGSYDHSSTANLTGDFSAAFAHVLDSETRHSEWQLTGVFHGSRQSTDRAAFGYPAPVSLQPYSTRDVFHNLAERFTLVGDQRWYPKTPAWFIAAGVAGTLSDWQRGSSGVSRSFLTDGNVTYVGITQDQAFSFEQRFYGTKGEASLRTGWGRVRNASSIYDAQILETRLFDAGVLRQRLSAHARQELAALLYGQSDVVLSRGRPASDFWGALESLLVRDGAIGSDGLSARGATRAMEPYLGNSTTWSGTGLPSAVIPRSRGWLVSAGIVLASSRTSMHDERHTTTVVYSPGPDGGTQSDLYFVYATPSDAAQIELAGEYHRPLSLRVQCDLTASARQNVDKHLDGHQIAASGAVTWMVADRWWSAFSGTYSNALARTPDGKTNSDTWRAALTAEAHRFVAEHYSLDATWALQWARATRSRIVIGGYDTGFTNDSRLSLGLSYRFAGFASIPGLFPAPTTP